MAPVSWHEFVFGATDLDDFLADIRQDMKGKRTPKVQPVQLLSLFLSEVLRTGPCSFGMRIRTFSVAAIAEQLASSDWRTVNARCRKLLAFASRAFVALDLGLSEVRPMSTSVVRASSRTTLSA